MSIDKLKSARFRIASRYFLKRNQELSSEHGFLLNEKNSKRIHQIRVKATLLGGLTGVVFAAIYFIIIHVYAVWFNKFSVQVLKPDVSFSWMMYVFAGVLVIIELAILGLINLRAVTKIAMISNFLKNQENQSHVESLISLSLEKKEDLLKELGLNPYSGLSKFQILGVTGFNVFKATITGFAFRFVMTKFLGRYMMKMYIDLLSVPVYAFWNAYSVWVITREAKIRMIAPDSIHVFIDAIKRNTLEFHEEFKNEIYDTMQFIVLAKRMYHYNLYMLASELFEEFDVELKEEHSIDIGGYMNKLKNMDPKVKESVVKVIIFGMLIDGSLSRREKGFLKELYNNKIIDVSPELIKKWENNFYQGKGLKAFVNYTRLSH